MYKFLRQPLLSRSRIFLACVRGVKVEARMEELGLAIPHLSQPKGNYINFIKTGNLYHIAGHLPIYVNESDKPLPHGHVTIPTGILITGRVGEAITKEEAYEAARHAGLNIICTLKHIFGDLDKVKRIVKLTGFVNCCNGFTEQPFVMNGASDLMVEVFREKGKHVRSAVGTNVLPFTIPVEIEAIVEAEN
mmetsp:Transcript_33839/g.34467  ORF Transcript_33839/g.34467 Transcript_33839/m.34467 type:complete len:191 (+) Transcript_33839:45-617(+)